MKGGEGWLIPIEDEERLKSFIAKLNDSKESVLNEIELAKNKETVEEGKSKRKYVRGHDDSDSDSDSDNALPNKSETHSFSEVSASVVSPSEVSPSEVSQLVNLDPHVEQSVYQDNNNEGCFSIETVQNDVLLENERFETPQKSKKHKKHVPPALENKNKYKNVEKSKVVDELSVKKPKCYDKEIKENIVKSRVELTKEKIARLEAKSKEKNNLNKKKRPNSDSSRSSTQVEDFYKNFSKNPVEFKKKHKHKYSRPSISSSSGSSVLDDSDEDNDNDESDDDYPLAETPKPMRRRNAEDDIERLKKEMLDLQKKVDLIQIATKKRKQ
jgi:hypothetical protein